MASSAKPLANKGHERSLVLVKALPQVGARYGETVCCAGVTPSGEWRRQYPIRFRHLQSKFARWHWIEYDWVQPGGDDRRFESRRVQEETLKVVGTLAESARSNFLEKVIVPSTTAAAALGQSLALIRPDRTHFYWTIKSEYEVSAERALYQRASSQLTLFDKEIAALEPCPFLFKFDYKTEDGKLHEATCGDWETSATFYRFQKRRGTTGALEKMNEIFNELYPARGMVFAMGTHSRYPGTWLLIGIIRLNSSRQLSLLV